MVCDNRGVCARCGLSVIAVVCVLVLVVCDGCVVRVTVVVCACGVELLEFYVLVQGGIRIVMVFGVSNSYSVSDVCGVSDVFRENRMVVIRLMFVESYSYDVCDGCGF